MVRRYHDEVQWELWDSSLPTDHLSPAQRLEVARDANSRAHQAGSPGHPHVVGNLTWLEELVRSDDRPVQQAPVRTQADRDEGQWEPWDPFGSADRLNPKHRLEMERGANWMVHIIGGIGDPSYFDYQTWIAGRERYHSMKEEAERERSR